MGANELWLVRHGESVANVAAAIAESNGVDRIDVSYRDADVPLSKNGERQAKALGVWLEAHVGDRRPVAFWASSYWRAEQTIEIAMAEAGLSAQTRIDERLRDRELGVVPMDVVISVA
jgi:broad specificity phosphatase PhoE